MYTILSLESRKERLNMKFYELYKIRAREKNKANIEAATVTARNCLLSAEDKKALSSTERKGCGELLKKVNNHIERYSLDLGAEECLKKILEEGGVLLASFFAKNATKQTLSEKVQLEFLGEDKLENLPSSTAESLRLHKGEIIQGTKKKAPTDATKSVDFRDRRMGALVCAKVTTTTGGGQDNQCEDVQKFVREAVKVHRKDKTAPPFVALLDGDYYTKEILKETEDIIPKKYKDKIIVCNSDNYFEKTNHLVEK